jgi:hypothetical protein
METRTSSETKEWIERSWERRRLACKAIKEAAEATLPAVRPPTGRKPFLAPGAAPQRRKIRKIARILNDLDEISIEVEEPPAPAANASPPQKTYASAWDAPLPETNPTRAQLQEIRARLSEQQTENEADHSSQGTAPADPGSTAQMLTEIRKSANTEMKKATRALEKFQMDTRRSQEKEHDLRDEARHLPRIAKAILSQEEERRTFQTVTYTDEHGHVTVSADPHIVTRETERHFDDKARQRVPVSRSDAYTKEPFSLISFPRPNTTIATLTYPPSWEETQAAFGRLKRKKAPCPVDSITAELINWAPKELQLILHEGLVADFLAQDIPTHLKNFPRSFYTNERIPR